MPNNESVSYGFGISTLFGTPCDAQLYGPKPTERLTYLNAVYRSGAKFRGEWGAI